MELTLSTASPLDALYITRDGQIRFKVETRIASSLKASARVSKVDCTAPVVNSAEDEFTHIADIEHNTSSPLVLRYQGQEVNTTEYFRKETWGECGRHRVFTGPDGREYRWLISTCFPELIVNDKSRTLVARFSPPIRRNLKKLQQASLKVFPPGESMLEIILITLLYIKMEEKRYKKGRLREFMSGTGVRFGPAERRKSSND